MQLDKWLAGREMLTRPARAKINLYFHLLGRRADGYHEVDSLVAFAESHDTLSILPGRGLGLAVDGPFGGLVPAGADNLVCRAAARLAGLLGRPSPDLHLGLTKNLPVAAGLGGGSADAAAVLRLLGELWNVPADHAAMVQVAQELGADVPICLDGRAARVAGIGDRIDRLATLPACGMVLVNPRVPLATPHVFAARRGALSLSADLPDDWPNGAEALASMLRPLRNDLTEAAIALAPVILQVLAAVEATQGCLLARMSGSGATCFGLFVDVEAARVAAGDLATTHGDWWVEPTRLLASA